jgi:hypothetical protein
LTRSIQQSAISGQPEKAQRSAPRIGLGLAKKSTTKKDSTVQSLSSDLGFSRLGSTKGAYARVGQRDE